MQQTESQTDLVAPVSPGSEKSDLVDIHDVHPRFIVSTSKPGKNMKLRKSRFRFGSFAFGHGTSSTSGQATATPIPVQPPSLPNFPVSSDPFFSHNRDSKLRDEVKFRSSSTTSLIRRSNSRVDAIDCSTTPILLAVRKRSCSDSGLDETSNSSQSCSPNGGDRKAPAKPQKSNGKGEGGSKMGGGFFRIFNKSATLLFKHPTTELNPNKPYKGTVTTSREQQHSSKKKASTLGASRRTPEEYLYYRRHQRWPSLTRMDKSSPLPPVAASSSMSSLNSSSLMPLHHHQAYSSGDDSGRPSGVSGASGGGHSSKKDSSSSSNSVISTCSSEGEDCDSGAFSRTSSPEAASGPTTNTSALLNTSSLSLSRMPPTEPLVAPSLVLAACLEYGVPLGDFDGDFVDASFVLSCLNAASRSSAFEEMSSPNVRSSSQPPDVSVTIGANTKLTITPDLEPSQVRRSGQLRRSRSGLPVLGTSVLQRTESPSKRLTQRNKISTVYLNPTSSPSTRASRSRLTRSESIVTVSGSLQRSACECTERVTVNGQHHCCENSLGRLAADFERFASLQQTSIVEVNSPPETQPNSIIDI